MKSENLQNVLAGLAEPFQALEDALWQLLTERGVDSGEGAQLDDLGEIVGQGRGGATDDDFRRLLRTRIVANKSGAHVEDIIRVSRGVVNDDDAKIIVDQQGAAAFVVEVTNVAIGGSVTTTLADFLRDAAAAGVRVIAKTSIDEASEMFTTARATFLDGALSGSETEIPVDSTDGFPAAGSLDIDTGLGVAETVTYGGKTTTKFLGTSAVANAHSDGAAIQLATGPGKGLGDEGDSALGGKLARAVEG